MRLSRRLITAAALLASAPVKAQQWLAEFTEIIRKGNIKAE